MTQGIYEKVRILAAVESECHLVQIGCEMFCADLMPRSNNAVLQQGESGFHSVRVNVAVHVQLVPMPNGLMFQAAHVCGNHRLRVSRHAEKSAQPEDVEDWTQDLLIHLRYLPPTSKYRKAGKEDIVQTFDPAKHHGANVHRFLNYINLCLGNKFRTMQSARTKNPLCRTGNVALSVQRDAENCGRVDDEYCHAHSEHLRKSSEHWRNGRRIATG